MSSVFVFRLEKRRENNEREKQIVTNCFEVALIMARAIGGFFLVLAVVLAVEGINLSQKDVAMVETLNLDSINADPYPVADVDYELEARIVDGKTDQAWYSHAIVANYGDTIEVRLKASAAEVADANLEAIAERLSFMSTAGLAAPTVEIIHKKVILPDGTAADYLDDFADERITYIAAGTYRFSPEDWLAGESASELRTYVSGDTRATLIVISPYCEVPIRDIAVLLVLAVVCGLVLPPILKVVRAKLKRLEKA